MCFKLNRNVTCADSLTPERIRVEPVSTLPFSIGREKINKKTLKYKQEDTQSQRRNALAPFVSVSVRIIKLLINMKTLLVSSSMIVVTGDMYWFQRLQTTSSINWIVLYHLSLSLYLRQFLLCLININLIILNIKVLN